MSSDARGASAPSKIAAGDFYTMGEAARLKGVSYHTVSRAVRRGLLPAQRLGKMVFISVADLQAWKPMVERAPHKFRRRVPVPDAVPTLIDLASGERVQLAGRLSVLLEVAEVATRGLPLAEVLGLLCDRLAGVLDLRRVAIWRVDHRTGQARRLASYGPPLGHFPPEASLSEMPQLGGFVRRSDEAIVVDVPAFGDRVPAPLRDLPSLLVAPLRVGDRPLGYIFGDRNGAAFALTSEELGFAKGIANHAALALALARDADSGAMDDSVPIEPEP